MPPQNSLTSLVAFFIEFECKRARVEEVKPADLLPQIYAELRRLAAAKLANEAPGHTLDATALVHEAFLKLGGERSFTNQLDYFRAAAEAMRRILIDHARQRKAVKRGGGQSIEVADDAIA